MVQLTAAFLGPRLEALAHESASVREAAVGELRQAGASTPEIVDGLLQVMRRGEYYSSMQAALALAGFGQAGLAALTEALGFQSYGVAWHAADAIGRIDDRAAVPDLMTLVSRGVEEAITALGHIGTAAEPAVPLLIRVVENRKTHDGNAPYVTGGSPRSMAWEAAEALGNIGDARAVQCLIAMLHDGNGRSRWTAAEALGKIRDRAALPALEAALADHDRDVREKVRGALERLKS